MTSGKLVFGHTGAIGCDPCVYEDRGWYEGTRKEHNVRKVREVEVFEHLDSEHVKQTLCGPDAKRYGARWGGGMSGLFPIVNEAAIATLTAQNAEEKAEAERKEAEAEKQEIQRYKRLQRSGICPKCGTWCYGDCEAW